MDHLRLTLVELIDDINDLDIGNFDSQAAATNICNIALSDLREDELGNPHKRAAVKQTGHPSYVINTKSLTEGFSWR